MTLLGITLLLLFIITMALWYDTEPDSKTELAMCLVCIVMGMAGLTLILI